MAEDALPEGYYLLGPAPDGARHRSRRRRDPAGPRCRVPTLSEVLLIAGKDPLAEIGGGHSAYVRVHGRAAVRAGITPHIFCASDRSGIVETDFGVVHRVKSIVPLRFRNGMGSPRYIPLVVVHSRQIAAQVTRFLLSRRGPHLIHAFGVWGDASPRVRKSLRRRGIETIPILSMYTTIRHESLAKVRGMSRENHGLLGWLNVIATDLWTRTAVDRCERRALAGAQVVLVNYESVRRLLPAGRRNGASCLKLPYTSESAFLHGGEEKPPPPASLSRLGPADVPLVLAVSRHDPRKGIDVLLHALARLRAGGVPFRACLVGGGILLEGHRRLAERLGISDRTSIEGFVDDAWPFLGSADIFVLPSLEEGSGSLALIEAMQAGLAVVASDCDGIPEDVADGDSALLVPPGDAEALARALARVLREPSLRGALARRARGDLRREVLGRRLHGSAGRHLRVPRRPGSRPLVKILDVSPRVASLPQQGSAVRVYNLLRQLSRRHDVRQFSQVRWQNLHHQRAPREIRFPRPISNTGMPTGPRACCARFPSGRGCGLRSWPARRCSFAAHASCASSSAGRTSPSSSFPGSSGSAAGFARLALSSSPGTTWRP